MKSLRLLPLALLLASSALGAAPNVPLPSDAEAKLPTYPTIRRYRARFNPVTFFVALDGDDTNPGTKEKPFRTIQKAVGVLRPSDVLNIRGGVYHERVSLTRSGDFFGKPITIQATPGEEVVIDHTGMDNGEKTNGSIDEPRAIFDTNSQDHLVIRGLTVRNGGFCGISITGSWRVRVENCHTFNTAGSGIIVDKSAEVVVSGCEIVGACSAKTGGGEESFSIKRSQQVLAEKNYLHDTFHEGIDVKEGSSHVRCIGNRFERVERMALYAEAWDAETFDIRFEGNIATQCMNGADTCTESGGVLRDVWIVNNVFYDCWAPGIMVADWGSRRMSHRIQGVHILNNTVLRCGKPQPSGKVWGGGIILANPEAEDIEVANNIVSGNYEFQIEVKAEQRPKNIVIRNNLIDGKATDPGENPVAGTPKFVDEAHQDYHLTADSPGLDRGLDLPGLGAADFAGQPRRSGAGVDLGALERQVPATAK